jgi:hypothetical protein
MSEVVPGVAGVHALMLLCALERDGPHSADLIQPS